MTNNHNCICKVSDKSKINETKSVN